MAFPELKALLVERVKRQELCPNYQRLVVAQTYQELIEAAAGIYIWSYQAGIADDDIIAQFPEDVLNANNIYTTGVLSLTNPALPVYLFGSVQADIILNDDLPHYIFALANCHLQLSMSGNAYTELDCYNTTTLDLTLTDAAACGLSIRHNVVATASTDGSSVIHASTRGASTLLFGSQSDAFSHFRAFGNSAITYQLAGNSEMDAIPFENATIQPSSSSPDPTPGT